MPEYNGANPTREDDEGIFYEFSGWSPNETLVNGDQIYTAQFVNGFLIFLFDDDFDNSCSVTCQYDADPISIEIPSIYFGKPVTSIGERAFLDSSSLTSILIPDSITSIGNFAFSHCTSLTSIIIPDSVTSIGEGAFYNCSSLASINVTDNNNNYSSIDGVLYNKNKTTLINYPSGKLENIFVIPDSVTIIGDEAFLNCTSLTSIIIPDSVTSIGQGAFRSCTSLTSIVIPDSVTSISNGIFYKCTSLTIYAEASSKPSGWHNFWNEDNRPVVWGYTG